jgi:hypothetical protein
VEEAQPISMTVIEIQIFTFSTDNSAGTASRSGFSTYGRATRKNFQRRFGSILIR